MNQPTKESLRLQNEELKRTLQEGLGASEQLKRELEIEAALEEVRSRSLSMHQSEELKEVVAIVFDKFRELSFETDGGVGIAILNDETKGIDYWAANPDYISASRFTTPFFDHIINNDIWTARDSGSNFLTNTYSFEEKNSWWNYVLDHTDFKHLPNENKKMILESESMTNAFAISKNSAVGVVTYLGKHFSKEEIEILKRFAKVFEQSYIRFLDLQKAEAQAREVQIQLALERVRARTMAMQKSEELADVALSLFQQVRELGIKAMATGFNVWQEDNNSLIDWMVGLNGYFIEPYSIDLSSHPIFKALSEARKRGEDFHVFELEGKGLAEIYELLNTFIKNREFEKFLESGIQIPTRQINHYVFGSRVSLLFITYEPCPEAWDIFKRFGKVFEQTYTRFLDLRKVEGQARESQTQAALERVRSRSMGMQKSDELKEVIQVVFDQFVQLNIPIEHTGFVMDYKARDDYNIWVADPRGVPSQVTIPYFDSVYYNRFNEAKEKGEDFFATNLSFEEKNRFYQTLFEYIPGLPEEAKEFYFSCSGLAVSTVLLEDVCLYIENFSGIPYSDEENNTLMRFGKVFQQTYTRFLDLEKAEAQARESQIEAALERVRSRSMGMQKSEELREIIQVIYEQFIQLGIHIASAGFATDYMESDDFNFWFADSYSTYPKKVHIPYLDHPQFNGLKEAKVKGVDFFANSLTFDEKNKFIDHVLKAAPPIRPEFRDALYNAPGYVSSHVFLKNLVLYILNYTDIPFSDAENAILMRFGKAFEQAYIRFLDLQKAEAQALEATKRASVDRVRAEIASMRTTSDLERIQPLIWNELTTLGVPFIRCGVFIMDEEKQKVQTMLSTPEGKAIAILHVPFEFNLSIITNGVQHWRKKKVYTEHWDAAAFIKAWSKLSSLRETSMDSPQAEHPPENLYLHLLPFLQGMLYVGNDVPLKEDELQLVQNLADTFSTAYARYEDFSKLESAKEQIEKTLVDLKQTQAQLVQSEKMASLGELTAGIAHEIQNPLNFVNNFSEVNKELIAEMREEIAKGNYDEVNMIAKDVEDNQEKINHHGKRADAIVKGMLQHSRSSTGIKEPTDINTLADEYLRLSYHGFRAKDNSFNATIKTDFDESIGKINIIPQDIGRVVLNLIGNAFYAVNEKKKQIPTGYEPTVSVITKKSNAKVEVIVRDNGKGIPQKLYDKIFQPFFTTKPAGEGTGLGLSLAYDIVKAHGGELKVVTKEGEGSEFIIELPSGARS